MAVRPFAVAGVFAQMMTAGEVSFDEDIKHTFFILFAEVIFAVTLNGSARICKRLKSISFASPTA
jgi:hypothetical protein